MRHLACLTALLALSASLAHAAEPAAPKKKPYTPFVAPASDEAEEALAQFTIPPGFKIELFAAEPQMANVAAFTVDEQNRFYVVETFRRKNAVIDIRGVMHWLDTDLASRTVGARIAELKKFQTPEEFAAMTKDSERIRLLEDRDGDGRADFDAVFTDGHNRVEDGIAAGVLVRNGDVWFTNVPSLWRLKDTDGDGVADVRDELQYGYGVRYNFNGHDLHGLRFGPDGKLYFSMGDRGLHVEKTPDGRVVSCPDAGAVLRCNPDGTELELVHVGLRNPQELAFDEFGNLFTGDNNSDGGDAARWVYVVEGGDSGWRVGYQYQDWPITRGPWNHEGVWMDDPPYPAMYIVPPVIELDASGPSGLTYYPGTGGPDEFKGRFFLADFRGGPALSSVWALKHEPMGAGFKMVEQKPILGNLLCTDVEFGWDGMYISDWITGWVTQGKGRLYRLKHEEAIKAPLVTETRALMKEGMGKRAPEELAKLLAHQDQRVRQAAQFELALRGDNSAPVFADVASKRDNRLARLHAIWGLGQLARKSPDALKPVMPLLSDADDEVRAQAVKVAGDVRFAPAYDALVKAMSDKSPRVRFFAAQSLGKLGRKDAGPAIVELIRANDDKDPYLRHAGVMALTNLNDRATIDSAAKDKSGAVRLAALLALRRLNSPDVAQFLDDDDDALVLEAARAINDVPIEAAMPKLAKLIDREGLDDPVATRVLNANYRDGSPTAAAGLARYANSAKANEQYRVEALRMLGTWDNVSGRDRVTGNWRPVEGKRDMRVAQDAAKAVMGDILRKAPDAVRVAAAGLVTKLGVNDPVLLAELSADRKLQPDVRAAALAALAETGGDRLAPTVEAALKDPQERVRAAAVRALGKLPGAAQRLSGIIRTSVREQQAALATLASLPGEEPDRLLAELLENIDSAPPEIHLDILDAAATRKSTAIAELLKQYEAKRKSSDPLAAYQETLHGGDAQLGEQIFRERADVSCLRCHSIKNKGGNAGPDLVGLANRTTREYMLESIIQPGKVISPGYESVAVRLKDGKTYAGILKKEDDKTLRIVDPGKSDVRVDKADIKSRRGGMSSMPENIKDTLSKQDVRNLVEFLASLKDENPEPDPDPRNPKGLVRGKRKAKADEATGEGDQ